MIPQDPVMLLSFINVLCDDLDVSKTDIEEKLKSIGYSYDSARNQFI